MPLKSSLYRSKNSAYGIFITSRFLSIFNIAGITIFPFVFMIRKSLKSNEVFINHERIHLKQQLELLIVPFYIWYVIEYLLLRIKMNHHDAYKNIVFEREAYQEEKHLEYLKDRKLWNFLSYYKKE